MKNKKIIYGLIFIFIIVILITVSMNLSKVISASDYSLNNQNIELDGKNNKEVEVSLISAGGGKFYSLDANWNLNEDGNTSYIKLTNLTSSVSSDSLENSISTGKVYYVDNSYKGFEVSKGGKIWTAKYTVDKNTPAGTYKVKLKINSITGGQNGFDSEEKIELTANIKVTRIDDNQNEIDIEKNNNSLNIIGNRITKEELIENLNIEEGKTVEIVNKAENQEYIGTGSIVTVKKNGTLLEQYQCVIYGDLNGNGIINTGDVISIQRVIAGINNQTELEIKAGDLSKNGKLDTGDALRVQRYIAGITEKIEIKK